MPDSVECLLNIEIGNIICLLLLVTEGLDCLLENECGMDAAGFGSESRMSEHSLLTVGQLAISP